MVNRKITDRIRVEDPDAFERLYSNLVVGKIRCRYTLNEELAILRQRDEKPDEFAEYHAYVEECKAEAKAELGI